MNRFKFTNKQVQEFAAAILNAASLPYGDPKKHQLISILRHSVLPLGGRIEPIAALVLYSNKCNEEQATAIAHTLFIKNSNARNIAKWLINA
jgi:hypothetical protein